MHTRRDLNQEQIKQFIEFMKPLIGHEHEVQTGNTIKQLFEWHNLVYILNREHGRNCPPCRNRVYYRMLKYYEELTTKQEIIIDVFEVLAARENELIIEFNKEVDTQVTKIIDKEIKKTNGKQTKKKNIKQDKKSNTTGNRTSKPSS